jgi:hypothetical protein
MKKNNLSNLILLIIALTTITASNAFAKPKLITNFGINKLNVVDENLKVPSNLNYSLSYGIITTQMGFNYSITTNRGLEQVNKTAVQYKSNGRYDILKTRITSDVLTIGYNQKRSIYSFNLMNVQKTSKIKEIKQTKNAIMYGISYSYILNRDFILTGTILAPNHGLGVKNGGILTLGYIW